MKTVRERFDEFSNREVVGSTKLKDFKYLYPDLLDFIEQELKKEREEIVEMVSKEFDRQSESCTKFGHEPILYLSDTKRIIINTIKN